MQRLIQRLCCGLFLTATLAGNSFAQKALTWQEVRDKFEAANPTLQAGQIGIDESRAQEITAYLRPNPNLTLAADQIDPFPGGPPIARSASCLPVATRQTICTNGSTNENCVWKVLRRQQESPSPVSRTWKGLCFSICGRLSCRRFRKKPFSISPRKTSPITTRFSM